jgi:hypothetical protein
VLQWQAGTIPAIDNKNPDLFILLFLSRRCRGVGCPANNIEREQNERKLTKGHENLNTGAGNVNVESIEGRGDVL